jgi:hypothetical protein
MASTTHLLMLVIPAKAGIYLVVDARVQNK